MEPGLADRDAESSEVKTVGRNTKGQKLAKKNLAKKTQAHYTGSAPSRQALVLWVQGATSGEGLVGPNQPGIRWSRGEKGQARTTAPQWWGWLWMEQWWIEMHQPPNRQLSAACWILAYHLLLTLYLLLAVILVIAGRWPRHGELGWWGWAERGIGEWGLLEHEWGSDGGSDGAGM